MIVSCRNTSVSSKPSQYQCGCCIRFPDCSRFCRSGYMSLHFLISWFAVKNLKIAGMCQSELNVELVSL